MLDLRPLVFVNILAFLLLVTAGFARVNDRLPVHGKLPAPSEAATIPEATATVVNGKTLIKEEDALATVVTETSPFEDFKITEEQQSATLEEAVLFVDQLPETEQTQSELPAEALTVAALGSANTALERTAEKAAEPLATPAPEPKAPALPETGDLLVRSNVTNDQVLVNGRPRGSSGKRLSLPAGEYEVVVAKEGYRSWRSIVDLARGDNRTLVVTLERITRVDYSDGSWKNGVVTGTGTYVADGITYEGEFLNKKFHGKGRMVSPDGATYEGEWFNGNKHGTGTLNRTDGSTYVGEFRDDQFNGQGTLTDARGTIWSGYWVNGTLNGDGSITMADGTLYSGGMVNNQYQGNGSITYPDGTYYEGQFANGQYQGKGELTFADGKKYSGNFLENQFHGQGILMNPNGSNISGSFKFGKPFGVVTLTTAEGEIFTARTDKPGVCYRLKSYRATECPVLEGW